MCSTSSFAFIGCWVVQGLIGLPLLWSGVRPGSIRLSFGGHPEAPASHPDQCSRRLIWQKLLVVECSAKGLVGYLSEMTARMKLLSWYEQPYERYSTSDSLPTTCRGLIGLRILWLTESNLSKFYIFKTLLNIIKKKKKTFQALVSRKCHQITNI